MLAAAAIGGSHLVSSTQAGAIFGWGLVPVLVAVNIAKYPFFRAAVQYTSATGETILHGYKRLGRASLLTFFAITLVTAVLNVAGVVLITASLAIMMGLPDAISIGSAGIVTTWICAGLVLANRFALLNGVIKFVILALFAATLAALVFAVLRFGGAVDPERTAHALDLASIGFIIQFMGWMPAPIDVAAWPSLWAREQAAQLGRHPGWRERSVDFHVGYVGTVVLALIFLALGKIVFGGSDEAVPMIGGEFAEDLIDLYVAGIGAWAAPLISGAAFLTMFSTALTCFDAWPRALALSVVLLSDRAVEGLWRTLFLLGLALACLVIIGLFASAVGDLLFWAMVISFTASPVLALFNLRAMQLPNVPHSMRFGPVLTGLGWFGLVFLVVGCVFLVVGCVAFFAWLVAV
jgi:Mn2+/Fe2+ NRAMP family transporter